MQQWHNPEISHAELIQRLGSKIWKLHRARTASGRLCFN